MQNDGSAPTVSQPYSSPRSRTAGASYRVEDGASESNAVVGAGGVTSDFPSSPVAVSAGPLGSYVYICVAAYLIRTRERVVSPSVLETLADWGRAGTTGADAANDAIEEGLLSRVKGGYRVT